MGNVGEDSEEADRDETVKSLCALMSYVQGEKEPVHEIPVGNTCLQPLETEVEVRSDAA